MVERIATGPSIARMGDDADVCVSITTAASGDFLLEAGAPARGTRPAGGGSAASTSVVTSNLRVEPAEVGS